MLIAAIPAAFLISNALGAISSGNMTHQERADIVYRRLDIGSNSHGAIYSDYADEDLASPSDPLNYQKHAVIQMTGVTSDLSGVVGGTEGIQTITFKSFREQTIYLGAYANLQHGTIFRGDTSINFSRAAIINRALRLQNRAVPIRYVVTVGAPVVNVITSYMTALDGIAVDSGEPAVEDGLVAISEIDRMRSDALVEYCYAAGGAPILDRDISTYAGLAILQSRAAAGTILNPTLTPDDQRMRLSGALIDAPAITFLGESNEVLDSETAMRKAPKSITVQDFLSGPARIEIKRGGVLIAANSGLVNNLYPRGMARTYHATDAGLSALVGLIDDSYSVRAIDQAGNESSVLFVVDSATPTITVNDSNGLVEPGSVSAGHDVSITVNDNVQGSSGSANTLATFEIFHGNPAQGGVLLAGISVPQEADYVFNKSDAGLEFFAQLPEFPIYIRVTDKAGNTAVSNFSVITPPPSLSVSGAYGFLFDRLQGTASTIPSTIVTTVSVIIQDVVGIESVALPQGYGAGGNPGKTIIGQIENLSPGVQSFFVRSLTGKTTRGSINIETLSMSVSGTSAAFDKSTDSFKANASLSVQSSLPISAIEVFDAHTSSMVGKFTAAPISLAVPYGGFPASYRVGARDVEINTVSHLLQMDERTFSLPVTNNEEVGAPPPLMSVVGSGVDSKTIPFLTNGSEAPGFAGVMRPGVVFVTTTTLSGIDFVVTSTESPLFQGPLPIVEKSTVGTYALTVNGNVIVKGSVLSAGHSQVVPGEPIELTADADFVLTLNSNVSNVDFSHCLEVELVAPATESQPAVYRCLRPLMPIVSARPFVRAIAYSLSAPEPGPNHITVYPGGGQNFALGSGVEIAGLNAFSSGIIVRAGKRRALVDPEFTNIMGDSVWRITASSPVFYSPEFMVTFPINANQLTLGRPVYIARMDACNMKLYEADRGANFVSAQVSGFGDYAIVQSRFSNTDLIHQDGGVCHFKSENPVVTVGDTQPTSRVKQSVNVFGSLGFAPFGSTCRLGPTGTQFDPAGVIKLCYDPAVLAANDVTENDVKLYQFNESGHRELLENISVNFERGIVSASVRSLSSIFGVFTPTTPVPAVDLLPPITSLRVDGLQSPASTYFVVSTTSTLSLSATDQFFPGAPVSGVQNVRLSIDGVFIDTVATPAQLYTGPFNLEAGSHTLAFYSSDVVGNIETPLVVNVLANPPPTRGVGGLGIGRDAANRLWTVALDGGSVAIARTNDDGISVASAPLPNALFEVQWGVLFDDSGSAYAVGTAGGPSTMAADLAIYKASMDGSSIVASQIFDSGFANNDFIFDVAVPGWIAGAVQVSGPSDFETPGERVFKAALWRFNTADGVVSLSTAFASGAAMGVAVDGDGSIWVAGFVENPAPRSSRVLDLGLWHFAADGQTVLAGPFRREAYMTELSPNFATKILISGSAVTVVAPRGRTGGGTDLASVRFDKASGAVLAESAWRAGDGSGAYPAALLADGAGSLAAGGLDTGNTRGALWRYGADGAFASASLVAAGGARGAVVRSSELWLAVDNATTPFKVAGEAASPGALTDIQPPRVELAATAPSYVGGGTVFVSSTGLLSFTVTDDKLVAGDGLGSGGSVRYFTGSTGTFAAFGAPFGFMAEGAYSATFYGTDAADNPGPIVTRAIAVDVTEPAAMLVSSGSLYAIEAEDPIMSGVASGVGRIMHLIDTDPETCGGVETDTAAPRGTCANLLYTAPFSLSAGTHTVIFTAADNLGNGAEVFHSSYVVVAATEAPAPALAVLPSTGPIGVPFSISGSGFGAYGGSNTRVKFGTVVAPVSVWNDTTIVGTIPGLSAGAYAVTIERQHASSMTTVSAGIFTVTVPSVAAISPSSGYVGAAFALSGESFGPYAGPLTVVLIGGAAAPVSVWNDAAIAGTIPGVLMPGVHSVIVERRTADGGLARANTVYFEVTGLSVASLTPSSAPIGAPFTITGTGFGVYAGTDTRVKFGGFEAPLSAWTDTAIAGTVPGALSPGVVSVVVERVTGPGLTASATQAFRVLVPDIAAITPSFGPAGTTVTLTGTGFGPDAGPLTAVLLGGATAPLSSWTDTTIRWIVPSSLADGQYPVVVRRSPEGGSVDSAPAAFIVDNLAPVTTLLVDGLPAGSTSLVVLSTRAVGFAAADGGSGVFETLYSVNGATEAAFAAAFTLSPGAYSLVFRSRDRAGNIEGARAVSIFVPSPPSDAAPPLVRLYFPGEAGLGVERAVGGVVSVRGEVADASAVTWTLESAPGAAATNGFTAIASGAGNLSGLVAAWNTTGLSGEKTLRLRAVDAFGNASQATASVFVGAPAFDFSIGRKDSGVIVDRVKRPSAIAVRSDGSLWVASAESDEILLISPAGVLLGAAGLSFKSPQGLALDAAGNLYVADRDLNRVVKLSPDGRSLLLQVAKTDGRGRPKSGSGPGELLHPFDVAVDVNGDIFVADSGNRRIQVFNSSGAFLRQFGSDALLPTSEVRGIALTSRGLWVSDKEAERIFLFNRAGALIQSIGDVDSAVGEISRTRGLAADRLGGLYVVEPNRDRTQKFDPQGKGMLAFGSKAGLSHADKAAKRYLTEPVDAAVAPDGSLWIADAGRDRVVRYAPGEGAAVYAAANAGGGAGSSAEPTRRVVDHKDGATIARDDGAGSGCPRGRCRATSRSQSRRAMRTWTRSTRSPSARN